MASTAEEFEDAALAVNACAGEGIVERREETG
jgi:hypothetical protein